MSYYVDSHCHLNDEAYKDDLEAVIEDAINSGVCYLNVIGYDLESSKKAIELANKYKEVYTTIGIHPENIEGLDFDVLDEIKKLASDPKVIAIGEIGLDYYWYKDKEIHKKQKQWFIKQIELANELDLPISIHAREASNDTYEILANNNCIKKGVLHCYSGSTEMLKRFYELGYYFGFDGPITYKNAIEPKKNVEICPLDRILSETDCPYLTPVPFRGKRNSPAYIPYIVKQMAEIKQTTEELVKQSIEDNFKKLFHVK